MIKMDYGREGNKILKSMRKHCEPTVKDFEDAMEKHWQRYDSKIQTQINEIQPNTGIKNIILIGIKLGFVIAESKMNWEDTGYHYFFRNTIIHSD